MSKDIIKYNKMAILIDTSQHTVRGYSTKKGGEIFKATDGGVPYPEGVINVLKHKMSVTPKTQEEKLKELKEHYVKAISRLPYEKFLEYIDSVQEEKGLEKKVSDEKQEKILDIPETQRKLDVKKQEPKKEPVYGLRDYLSNKPEEENPKARKPNYPYLTEEELNMPVTNEEGIPQPYDLIVSIMKEVDDISKTLIENPRTKKQKESNAKKQEKIRELWKKRRSIIAPWEDGVFNQN